ncbi:hypothetical protein DSECCO2_246540 [anaerobic digester metagenome]
MYPNGRETGCRQSKVAVFLNKPKGREPLKRLVECKDAVYHRSTILRAIYSKIQKFKYSKIQEFNSIFTGVGYKNYSVVFCVSAF